MAYNGSGVYSPPGASFPAVTGTVIDSTKYNAVVNDIATALTTAITKDGQTTITANLPMATYRHTGVSDGAALTDYASVNQVVDNALGYGGASAAGTDTYAVSLAISPVTYVAGNRYQFLADVANTGACTINFNGIGAKSIKMVDGNDPFTNAIQIGMVDVVYDGTNFVLLNPFFDFLNVTGQVTATHTELNLLDGCTADFSGITALASADDVIDNFPSGTLMLFQQTAAPTGWTKQTTHNDKALRVVSGAASSGGTVAFETAFASQAVAGTNSDESLSIAQMPAHTHTINTYGGGGSGAGDINRSGTAADGSVSSVSAGSGDTHTHTFSGTAIDLDVSFVDIIIASKD